jgi:hypothetical protein
MRLNPIQKRAINVGSPRVWLGCAEVQVDGTTMDALARRGLAEVRLAGDVRATGNPRRFVYKLTAAGNELRVDWAINEAARPVEHTPIRVRCTHCSEEFPDGTPGGSCRCGLPVEAVA